MIIILSPAKTLDPNVQVPEIDLSTPVFLKQAAALVRDLKPLSEKDLEKLMGISPALAAQAVIWFAGWKTPFTPLTAKPAAFLFKGDVYTGLNIAEYGPADLEYAQQHLRIISGLYGVLKPLDLIMPYRLEMGTSLKGKNYKDLYDLWKGNITDHLAASIESTGSQTLVNLASNEYSKAVDLKRLGIDVITPVFKDWKNGEYKMISFFAKKARGMMASYIIRNRIEDPERLLLFNEDGYVYNDRISKHNQPVFTRE